MEDKIWDILEKVRLEQLTVNDGTQQVLDLFVVSNSVCLHEPQYQSYNKDTGLQVCDRCGVITN